MISPSSLPGIAWSSSAPLGAAPNAATTAADSFQNILAQAVTPDFSSQTTSASSVSSGWTNGAGIMNDASSMAAPATLPSASLSSSNDQTAAGPSPEDSNARANSRNSPQRGGTQKQEHANRATPADSARSTAASSNANDQDPMLLSPLANQTLTPAGSSLSSGNSLNKKSASGAAIPNGLPSPGAAALGGLKSLSGAAFALQITPASNQASTSQSAAATASAAADSSAATNALSDALSGGDASLASNNSSLTQPLLENATGANLTAVAAFSLNTSEPTPANGEAPVTEETPLTMDAAEISAEDPVNAPQALRSVQVQLTGEGDARVDLRLVQHDGGLSVSVRSSDSALTQGLRENLPELSARLEAEKYQVHTFIPAANETSGSGASASSSGQQSGPSDQQSGSRSFSQGGGQSAGGDASRQQNGQSGGQPDESAAWWRQMAALGKLSQTSSTSAGGSLANSGTQS